MCINRGGRKKEDIGIFEREKGKTKKNYGTRNLWKMNTQFLSSVTFELSNRSLICDKV